MSTRLIESLAATEALSGVFSDANVLQAMLDFEVALARTEARMGVIPAHAAETIAAVARAFDSKTIALAVGTDRWSSSSE